MPQWVRRRHIHDADDGRRGPSPAPLRGRASAALILGSTEGAKEPGKFKTNKNACQTLRPILRVLQLGSNSLKQGTLPGVVQKPLVICRRKALILKTAGSVKWWVQKQMFLSLLVDTCLRGESDSDRPNTHPTRAGFLRKLLFVAHKRVIEPIGVRAPPRAKRVAFGANRFDRGAGPVRG